MKYMDKKNRFISKALEKHNNKYDYSKVEYVNADTKVCIICPEHGEFWQTPHQHLRGIGCKLCGINRTRKGKEKFIQEARQKHGNKYDYSKVEYTNAHTKVCIICPNHGEFWQKPSAHLMGQGCPECRYQSNGYTTEEWVEKAKSIYGDKYDYSKVEYINSDTRVCIICPKHGEFWMKPTSHMKGHECPKCQHRSFPLTTEEWVERAKKVHGDKYDYSKVEYKNIKTNVCIICPEHGEFWQKPWNHINSGGCYKCGKKKYAEWKRKTKEEFIENSKKIYGDWFLYDKVDYIDNKTKVCITCKKHGDFMVRPDGHLFNRNGCPQCAAEKNVQETILFEHLKKRFKNVSFFHSKRGIENLGLYEIDIYDKKHKIGIEYQGNQHFKPVEHFGGEHGFIETLNRDHNKIKLCEENGIKLFHFTYNKNYCQDNINYKVYTEEEELFSDLEKIYKEKGVL